MSGTPQLEWDEGRIAKSIVANLDRIEGVLESTDPMKIKKALKEVVHKIVMKPQERRVPCSFFRIPLPAELGNSGVCLTMPEGGIEPPRGVSPAGF